MSSILDGKCTERSNAFAQVLRDTEPMFRLLFERCADAIWLFDPDCQRVLDCNEAAVRLMRCQSKEQLLCACPTELAPAAQADGRCSNEAAKEMNRLVREKGSHRFEWLARRFDGTEVPLEVLVTPVQCNGQELHVVFSRDISERKQAEAALHEHQQLLASITENISDAVYRTGPNQELVFVNRAYLHMFGYDSLEELRSIPRERLYARPEDRRHVLEVIKRFGGFRDMELQYARKDGSLFWGLVTSVAIRDPETGRVNYHVGSIRDITHRKESETEIRRLNTTLEERVVQRTGELTASEARLRTLIEHAPDAIVVLDGNTGQFVACNENAARLYGRSREQLLKLRPWDVSPPCQANGMCSTEGARQWIQQALEGDAPVFEWTHRHSSGRLVPCEVRLVRLPGEGTPLVRGSIIDNTERKRREAIQQATYQISEAVHTVEDLDSLYGRVHEIVQTLMPARNFYIALLDRNSETISFPYYIDQARPENPGPRPIGTGLTGYVLRSGKPLLMDAAMDARKRKVGPAVTIEGMDEISYLESGSPAAIWLGVPLVLGGRPFGVMAVQDYEDDQAYGEEEKQILAFVAAQTALAIERKRAEQTLRERTERALRHRAVLLRLAQMDKTELDHSLQEICELAAATFRSARVSYWSLEAGGDAITCETLYSLAAKRTLPEAKGTRLTREQCPAYFDALASHEPIIAGDAQTHPATRELAAGYLVPLGISSMLDAPVWLDGKVVGVLCHEHVGPVREWLTEEIDFAASLATMVSLSIEAAQRARSENALRESEQKFRALFEASGQGVMLHDANRFLEVNPAAVRILRYDSAEQIIGKSPAETSAPIQPNGDPAAVLARKYIAECIEKGTARFDWVALSPKGEEVPLEVILTTIPMGGRSIIQAVINDISERKKTEQELLRALAREKELGELKSNFVSMVSHEFRTPLGIVMSSAEILRDYLEQLPSEERKHHLLSITRSVRRMADLMEEVLVLGRLDAGKMAYNPAPLNLPVLCRRIADEVLSATESRCPIQLAIESAPSEVHADERLLRHILTNLLTNAVKYSEPGSAVQLEVHRDACEAVCVVRDRGIGIAEEDKPWLFNAFHRGRNVGQRAGTGLGLVIVKRCVELHRGQIEINSKCGEGTIVTVRLPICPPSSEPA